MTYSTKNHSTFSAVLSCGGFFGIGFRNWFLEFSMDLGDFGRFYIDGNFCFGSGFWCGLVGFWKLRFSIIMFK